MRAVVVRHEVDVEFHRHRFVDDRREQAAAVAAPYTVAHWERLWLIDEYFKVLNCGTNVLDLRLPEPANPVNCLVFRAINPWKVFDITRLARDLPAAPAVESFSPEEFEVLNQLLNAESIPPPTLRDKGEFVPRGRFRGLQSAAAAGRHGPGEGVGGDQVHDLLGGGSNCSGQDFHQ